MSGNPSFWDHLDVLRNVLLKSITAWTLCTIVCFIFRDILFAVLFYPTKSDFILYRFLHYISTTTGITQIAIEPADTHFINTELTGQFATHLSVSLWSGLLLAAPYIGICFFGFVAPALYQNERKWLISSTISGIILFITGVAINYFIIFPFSFQFLSNYQVEAAIENHITLTSYITSILVMSMTMGIIFEIPIVGRLLAKVGIINATLLRSYRKHALIIILIMAAVITPTGDAFTLMLVTIPIYVLYEITIHIVHKTIATEKVS